MCRVFRAENAVYPDERAANRCPHRNLDADSRASRHCRTKLPRSCAPAGGEGLDAKRRKSSPDCSAEKSTGTRFTSNANSYFSEQALKDLAASLGPLGKPTEFSQASEGLRGGMTLRRNISVQFPKKNSPLPTSQCLTENSSGPLSLQNSDFVKAENEL